MFTNTRLVSRHRHEGRLLPGSRLPTPAAAASSVGVNAGDPSGKKRKKKLGYNKARCPNASPISFFLLFLMCLFFIIVAIAFVAHIPKEGISLSSDKANEVATSSRQHLPHVYWINLDNSEARRNVMLKSMKSSEIVDEHRVAACGPEEVSAMIASQRLIFHPKIKIYDGNGEPTFKKHPENFYTRNEAACLLSHLKAIKQAYDDGREFALILEDDAEMTSFFREEFAHYVAAAPDGWKVLQLATNNPHVVEQGSYMHEPFISWQRYHHSTRAYLINRTGMETLLRKTHSTSLTGETVWRIQEFPSVVADELVYTTIGDTYYSTGFWVDTSNMDSTIQKINEVEGRWKVPYADLLGKEKEQVATKTQQTKSQLFKKSLLVVMNVKISTKDQIEKEIEMIAQDSHAVCKFHHSCDWEVNIVAVDIRLIKIFEEAAFELPSYIHIHTNMVKSYLFNKFSFVRDIQNKFESFDLVLFKDSDQRLNGFPWRTFVERRDKAVLSSPLRSTQRDHMLWNTLNKKSQDVQFHDVNSWLLFWNGRKWSSRMFELFERITPIEVPYLETYFVLLDTRFARYFFARVFAFELLDDGIPNWGLDYLWCQAAFEWDSDRPSCQLIPLVSTHDDWSLSSSQREEMNENDLWGSATQSLWKNTNFERLMSPALEWASIVGKQRTSAEIEFLCLQKMNVTRSFQEDDEYDDDVSSLPDISGCANSILENRSKKKAALGGNAS